jgi:hypothetical protein
MHAFGGTALEIGAGRSRLGFERRTIELHQVLGAKVRPGGETDFPLRPDWGG